MYTCSKCGVAVIVVSNEIIKACNCNATIICGVSSNLTGVSKLKHGRN